MMVNIDKKTEKAEATLIRCNIKGHGKSKCHPLLFSSGQMWNRVPLV